MEYNSRLITAARWYNALANERERYLMQFPHMDLRNLRRQFTETRSMAGRLKAAVGDPAFYGWTHLA